MATTQAISERGQGELARALDCLARKLRRYTPTMDRNVLGQPLVPCSFAPRTGYFRDGCCRTDATDHGRHLICTQVTDEFLRFSASRGNDLSTPAPQFQFAGLRAGDRWCLCAMRWREALEAGVAPPVLLESTHAAALRYVSLEQLQSHAILG